MKEYIIKVDESKQIGSVPLMEPPKELIRCRDCKRHQENNCEVLIGVYNPYWFCADGERRTDDA